ncbi:MAG: hypothetical protein JW982_04255 [Spirochaetes bacterium]|nr:hypothetical protein [Spirochaetota bacterium]
MRNFNANRLFGITLLILDLPGIILYIKELSEGRVHVVLFIAIPLFFTLGAALALIPLNNKKLSDIIGDGPLMSLLRTENITRLINFNNVPIWKQAVYAVLILGAVAASVILIVMFMS